MLRTLVLGMALVVAAAVSQGFSQAPDQPSETTKPSVRRLPNYYSKVGLRQSQRDLIYTIQDRYAEQIEDLIRQVEELRKKRDAEMEMVLTVEQRQELKMLIEEAAAKNSSRKPAPPAAPASSAAPKADE